MFSATFSLIQVISLLAPGLILLVVVKSYFPLAGELWEEVTGPASASGPSSLYGPLIFILFFALAFGIMVQSISYSFTRWYFSKNKIMKNVNLGRMIVNLEDDRMNTIRGVYYINQTFFNMFIVLSVSLVKILVDPARPSENFIRVYILAFFILTSFIATRMSMQSLFGLISGVDGVLAGKEQRGDGQGDTAKVASLAESA